MNRVVQTELLDHLPPDTEDARQSRVDLRRINRVMGHLRRWPRLLANILPADRSIPWRVVELGAGDAELTAEIWPQLPPPPTGSRLVLVDRQEIVLSAPIAALREHGWIVEQETAEVGSWLRRTGGPRPHLIYCNLFLHHFDATSLPGLLGQIVDQTHAFVCLEPRRSASGLFAVRWLRLLGCNSVTRHDARCSVLAGFRDREISGAWPNRQVWQVEESGTGMFSHQFRAVRIDHP